MEGLGFRGLRLIGCRVWGLGFRVQGFRGLGYASTEEGSMDVIGIWGFRSHGFKSSRVYGLRIWELGFRRTVGRICNWQFASWYFVLLLEAVEGS